jgi:CoA:oxalate CoA-transferase
MMTVPGDMSERLANAMGIESQIIESQERVKTWVSKMTVNEVVETLVKARVPVAPVLNLEEVINDPHTQAREMIVEVDHPVVGKVKMPGFPIKFSETPVIIKTPAPLLGEHTEEVLTTLLGLKKEEIKKLREDGVI